MLGREVANAEANHLRKQQEVQKLRKSGLFTEELLKSAEQDVMATFSDPVNYLLGIVVERLVGWRPSAVEYLTGYDRKQIQIECKSGKIKAGRMGGAGDAGWHIISADEVIKLRERRNAYEQRRGK